MHGLQRHKAYRRIFPEPGDEGRACKLVQGVHSAFADAPGIPRAPNDETPPRPIARAYHPGAAESQKGRIAVRPAPSRSRVVGKMPGAWYPVDRLIETYGQHANARPIRAVQRVCFWKRDCHIVACEPAKIELHRSGSVRAAGALRARCRHRVLAK